MRITSSTHAPDLSQLAIEDQIDAELLLKEREQAELDGTVSVSLIDSAVASIPQKFENRPLNFGSVGRRINIAA